MNSWVVKNPVRLGFFQRRIPNAIGSRIVLFRGGIPTRVLPAGVASIKIGYLARLLFHNAVAVSDWHRAEFVFDKFLATQDAVEIVCRIAVSFKTKQDPDSIIMVSASSDKILARVREECFVWLQRRLRQTDYDMVFSSLSEIESDLLLEQDLAASSGRKPYSIENISILEVESKAGGVLSAREFEQIRRSEGRSKQLALEIGGLEFGVKKQNVEIEQALKSVPVREKIQLEKERLTAKNDTIRQIAEIRSQFGTSALPTSVQQAIILAGIQAKIAAAAGNMELANNIMRIAVNAAGADREKAFDLLKGTLNAGSLSLTTASSPRNSENDETDDLDASFVDMEFSGAELSGIDEENEDGRP